MKKVFGPIIKRFVRTKLGFRISKYLGRFAEWLRYERSLYDHEQANEQLKIVFSDLKVRDGIFKGLMYPSFVSVGSALFPKLAGNYESELHVFFKSIEGKEYQSIIDVGCAEGYYAIGLARKFPNSKVLGFDIDKKARKSSLEMARLNNVSERVTVREACTPEWLGNIQVDTLTLLICDCEGFERELFTSNNLEAFKKTDLVVEMYPFHFRDVKVYLMELFKNTHEIRLVSSYDNNRKLFDLQNVYQKLGLLQKKLLIEEGRPFTMEWLLLTAKQLS